MVRALHRWSKIADISMYIPNIPDSTQNYNESLCQIWCLGDSTWWQLANGLTFQEIGISFVERSPRDLQCQTCSRCLLCRHNYKSKMGNKTGILVHHYNFWLVLNVAGYTILASNIINKSLKIPKWQWGIYQLAHYWGDLTNLLLKNLPHHIIGEVWVTTNELHI